MLEVLDSSEETGTEAKQAVAEFLKHWTSLRKQRSSYEKYIAKHSEDSTVEKQNKAQRTLRESLDPFFASLHDGLKRLDKIVRQHQKQKSDAAKVEGKRTTADRNTNELKKRLEALHSEVRNAEVCFQHIHWLQERFHTATYEDVTGLCKLATVDEVKEQDYSLNPGRYVGVVIEEDGRTEDEFIEELSNIQAELDTLNVDAATLASIISHNTKQLVGD
jgi:type I restriction enzyme M protein